MGGNLYKKELSVFTQVLHRCYIRTVFVATIRFIPSKRGNASFRFRRVENNRETFNIVVIRVTLYRITGPMTGWKIPARGEKFRRSGGLEIYEDKICTKVSDINARGAARVNKMCESYTLDERRIRVPSLPTFARSRAAWRGAGWCGARRSGDVMWFSFDVQYPLAAVRSCLGCLVCAMRAQRNRNIERLCATKLS